MTTPEKMTGNQEYEHYAKAENQTPKGPARRRKQNLTEIAVPGSCREVIAIALANFRLSYLSAFA